MIIYPYLYFYLEIEPKHQEETSYIVDFTTRQGFMQILITLSQQSTEGGRPEAPSDKFRSPAHSRYCFQKYATRIPEHIWMPQEPHTLQELIKSGTSGADALHIPWIWFRNFWHMTTGKLQRRNKSSYLEQEHVYFTTIREHESIRIGFRIKPQYAYGTGVSAELQIRDHQYSIRKSSGPPHRIKC